MAEIFCSEFDSENSKILAVAAEALQLSVRITLSVDDDTAVLLDQEVRRSGASFKETVKRLLTLSLHQARKPQSGGRLVATPIAMGLGAGRNHGKIEALLEALEGPEHK